MSSIITTLSNIYDREFYENNASSFLHIFPSMANSDLQENGRNKVELLFNILAYSVITRHIQEVSRDITAHSEACVTPVHSEPWYIQNPGIFRTLAYSEPWYIQNHDKFWNLTYSEPWYIYIQYPGILRILAYLVPWCLQNPGIYRTKESLQPEPYSELWYIQDLKHIDNPAKPMR